jgi:hypothetical protein
MSRSRVLLLLVTLFASNAFAHHNMSAAFDFNDRVSLTGTLSKVDWRNPHIHLEIEVKAANGTTEVWGIEGPAPSFFRVRDIGKTDFEAAMGKTVKTELSRARDKSKSGLIRTLTLPDGKVVSACPQNC